MNCRGFDGVCREFVEFGMAERVGFEPTNACASAVFKTAAFNHSATFPREDAILTESA